MKKAADWTEGYTIIEIMLVLGAVSAAFLGAMGVWALAHFIEKFW